jgi:hypothetical protein
MHLTLLIGCGRETEAFSSCYMIFLHVLIRYLGLAALVRSWIKILFCLFTHVEERSSSIYENDIQVSNVVKHGDSEIDVITAVEMGLYSKAQSASNVLGPDHDLRWLFSNMKNFQNICI